jgi:hypothetical protein
MAALPAHNQPPHQTDVPEADTAAGRPCVQAVEKHHSPEHVASPAHALQARIVSELPKPDRRSVRRLIATFLVLSLSTWLAGFVFYAAL